MTDDTKKMPTPATDNVGRRSVTRAKIVLSTAALILGLATIVVTLASGGGVQSRGILLGGILAVMAGFRLYVTLRHDI